jgi:hypothetical protein
MIGKTTRISAVALVFLFATVTTVSHVLAFEDSDVDGLPDAWEMEYFGDLNQGPEMDFDGDGASNLEEFVGGTNPADPSDKPGPPNDRTM